MRIKLTSAAKQDIKDATTWYNKQKNGLGKIFNNNVIEAIEKIKSNPLAFQERYKVNRIIFVKKYPYGIHYKITEEYIIVIAVLHTSRSPKNWGKR